MNQAINDVAQKMGNDGRLYVRFSGTENMLRIMTEQKEENIAISIANRIAEIAKKELQYRKIY